MPSAVWQTQKVTAAWTLYALCSASLMLGSLQDLAPGLVHCGCTGKIWSSLKNHSNHLMGSWPGGWICAGTSRYKSNKDIKVAGAWEREREKSFDPSTTVHIFIFSLHSLNSHSLSNPLQYDFCPSLLYWNLTSCQGHQQPRSLIFKVWPKGK